MSDECRGLLSPGDLNIGDRDIAAGIGQSQRHGTAQTASRAGNDRDHVLQRKKISHWERVPFMTGGFTPPVAVLIRLGFLAAVDPQAVTQLLPVTPAIERIVRRYGDGFDVLGASQFASAL